MRLFPAGASLIGQQPFARYVDLSSLLQRSPVVSRSKVPGASDKKSKHRHQEHLKDKRKVKRQTLVEPILASEEPSSVDDLLQDDMTENYKRQLVLTPALETLQQLQPLQPEVLTQQALQPQPLQLRQLQLQQQLLQEQPLARQSLAMQPVDMQQQLGMQPAGIQQQVGMAGTPQLENILSLDSTPIRYMTSSLVTPMENLGPSLAGRSSSAVTQRMVSPLAPSLTSSSLLSPFMSNAISRPRNGLNSFQSLPPRGLLQDRSLFRHPLRLGYPSYSRRILHRPQYRRRLHDFREEDLNGIQPEVLGHEGITQEGSYTTEEVPSSEGETLINSPVGFGPITVEAKTAEGARAAQAAGEDKRHHIDKPSGRKHRRTQKANPSL